MRTTARSSGFTLVESVIALGLTAVLSLSVAGLAGLARRSIDAGRTSSTALAVARSVLDDLAGTSYDGTWRTLGLDGSLASGLADSRAGAWATGWQAVLVRSLPRSFVEVELTTIAPSRTTPLDLAEAIRVVVRVRWGEGPRARSVRLATVRT
jgi:type II secretory pathway pseudopilin PulG